MKLHRLILIFIAIIFLNGCGLSAQQWQEIGEFSSELNSTLYESNSSSSGKKTCIYENEYSVGFNKVCNYSCTGTIYAINLDSSAKICPLSIKR